MIAYREKQALCGGFSDIIIARIEKKRKRNFHPNDKAMLLRPRLRGGIMKRHPLVLKKEMAPID